jgi:ABC-type phosphate transport system substrate-binding protein
VVIQFLKKALTIPRIQWSQAWVSSLVYILLSTPVQSAEPIAIIVNENSPLTHISRTEVKEIYLGEIRFLEGMRITPVHLPEGPIKDSFLSSVIGRTSKAYKLHWTKKVFQEGLSIPPVKVDPGEIIEWVGKEPGAIGYAPKGLVENHPNVRIIHIFEGRVP